MVLHKGLWQGGCPGVSLKVATLGKWMRSLLVQMQRIPSSRLARCCLYLQCHCTTKNGWVVPRHAVPLRGTIGQSYAHILHPSVSSFPSCFFFFLGLELTTETCVMQYLSICPLALPSSEGIQPGSSSMAKLAWTFCPWGFCLENVWRSFPQRAGE